MWDGLIQKGVREEVVYEFYGSQNEAEDRGEEVVENLENLILPRGLVDWILNGEGDRGKDNTRQDDVVEDIKVDDFVADLPEGVRRTQAEKSRRVWHRDGLFLQVQVGQAFWARPRGHLRF